MEFIRSLPLSLVCLLGSCAVHLNESKVSSADTIALQNFEIVLVNNGLDVATNNADFLVRSKTLSDSESNFYVTTKDPLKTDTSVLVSDAVDTCKNLHYGDLSGWSLPTLNELRSLYAQHYYNLGALGVRGTNADNFRGLFWAMPNVYEEPIYKNWHYDISILNMNIFGAKATLAEGYFDKKDIDIEGGYEITKSKYYSVYLENTYSWAWNKLMNYEEGAKKLKTQYANFICIKRVPLKS